MKFVKKEETKKEIIPALNRRLILPLYIPVISLICSLLLLNSKKNYLNKISIFFYSFILLIFTEMSVRYTGINNVLRIIFCYSSIYDLFVYVFIFNFKFSNKPKSL